jgi:hypothetical protein
MFQEDLYATRFEVGRYFTKIFMGEKNVLTPRLERTTKHLFYAKYILFRALYGFRDN